MNTDVEVRPSPIHGMGVFAKRNFKKGEVILEWDLSEIVSPEKFEKLQPNERDEIARVKGFLVRMKSPAKYLNHSCEPNTVSQDGKDIALRDIAMGEEVTGNYADDLAPGESMLCACRSGSCKGRVRAH